VFPDLLLALECDHFMAAEGELEEKLIRGKKIFTTRHEEQNFKDKFR
jgi:hypothetical protein